MVTDTILQDKGVVKFNGAVERIRTYHNVGKLPTLILIIFGLILLVHFIVESPQLNLNFF